MGDTALCERAIWELRMRENMFVPYIHFNGNYAEAIALYEKAFNTKADKDSIDYSPDGTKIAHPL
jgi:hypothetical protein